MANNAWRNSANTAVAQVWKGTITTTTNGHTYSVTITDDDGTTAAITYTVANPPDTTTTLVATGFITAWNASYNPLISRFTASQSSGQVILTADTAGIPATFSTGGTGTWSGTGNTTACVSNNDAGQTTNWQLDAVPTTGDDVLFQNGSTSLLYGLNLSSAAVADVRVLPSYSGSIGRFTNGLGHYFRIDPDLVRLEGSGTLCMLDIGSAAIAPYIAHTGTPTTGYRAVYIKGSAITTLFIDKGNVGVAVLDGDTATITKIQIGYVSTQASDATVYIGSGVTLTTLDQGGGTCELGCAATTVNLASGSTLLTTVGSGAITTVNVYGATADLRSTGTITNLNVYGGTVRLDKSRTARTITNTTFYGDCTVYDGSWITYTNAPTFSTPCTVTRYRVG